MTFGNDLLKTKTFKKKLKALNMVNLVFSIIHKKKILNNTCYIYYIKYYSTSLLIKSHVYFYYHTFS